MIKAYFRLLRIVLLGSCLVFPVAIICSRILTNYSVLSRGFIWKFAPVAVFAVALYVMVSFLLRRSEPAVTSMAREQASFLDSLPDRWVDWAVVGSAGLSLFLELAVIRWQGTEHTIFAFYKNFGLLSCFAGLGLGYALAGRNRIPLLMVIPLLAWQMALLLLPKAFIPEWLLASLMATPIPEQLNMGFSVASSVAHYVAIYLFLIVIFLLTALTFIPVGQLCGRLAGPLTTPVSGGKNCASACGPL